MSGYCIRATLHPARVLSPGGKDPPTSEPLNGEP